ncbi:MAG: alpha/beta fold hydrolase [Planctomycetaceae bacterium]|nr:MAG: alpha/beta fold hydrolase [Planctomycetaceae bacterium]
MRKLNTFMIAAIVWTVSVIGIGWGISDSTAAPQNVAGKWLGTITFGSTKLRIAFEISEVKEGDYTASMRSIDQSAVSIPMSAVKLNGDSLRLEIDAIRSAYEGKFTADGNTIEGNWLQHGTTMPLVMNRVDKLPELNRPQTPKKPYPYIEEEVAYENQQANVRIAGSLTLPKEKGPFPAVLLITGSGALDRDETISYHKPFLVLADHLTRHGIAVLRVDKRGVGKTTGEKLVGDYSETTILDLADDVLAGVEYLKSRKEIDPKRIGLLGHSEGGVVGPIAASRSPDVAFLVMLAGLGQNNGDIIIFQKSLAAKEHGADENTLALIRSWYERLYAVLAEDTDNTAAEKKIRALHATLTTDEKEKLGWPDHELDLEIAGQLRPHWRYDLWHDPCAILRKVRCPVLALGGEKDMLVPAKENLAGIEQALKAGGNTRFTVREFPGMNHGFQTVSSGAASESVKTEETMSPMVLQTISDWIIAQTATTMEAGI